MRTLCPSRFTFHVLRYNGVGNPATASKRTGRACEGRPARLSMWKGNKDMTSASRPKGLEGVVVGDTAVSLVEGTEGRLSYRGYMIQDLAANSSYEEVLYLLLYGELPNKAQLDELS